MTAEFFAHCADIMSEALYGKSISCDENLYNQIRNHKLKEQDVEYNVKEQRAAINALRNEYIESRIAEPNADLEHMLDSIRNLTDTMEDDTYFLQSIRFQRRDIENIKKDMERTKYDEKTIQFMTNLNLQIERNSMQRNSQRIDAGLSKINRNRTERQRMARKRAYEAAKKRRENTNIGTESGNEKDKDMANKNLRNELENLVRSRLKKKTSHISNPVQGVLSPTSDELTQLDDIEKELESLMDI